MIIDPQVGDIYFAIIAGRDQTNAVANRAPSPPGSFRQHSMADAVYVGGFLGSDPTHYMQITKDGIRLVTTGKVTISASEVDILGDVNVAGSVTASGDVKAGGVSLENHVHGGVESGLGTTSKPK